ncbi:MAG: putative membrane protein YfcA [Colwellia sp.]|jgi:uncharacterized membrane protein YfcA
MLIDSTFNFEIWFTLCAIGFIAGLIDAIAGGGGMLTVPTLLSAGLPPHIALGTNKLAASFGSLTASVTFYRKKLFDPHFWRLSIIYTAIGAVLGTLAVGYLSNDFLEKSIPILIVITAIYTLLSKTVVTEIKGLPPLSARIKKIQSTQGFILGFYDGLAGPGTGAFWTASSSALYKINILLSCGLARSTNFVSNICSLLTFAYFGYVNFVIGISMGIFIMLGAGVGSHWAIKFGNRFIRPVFIVVVISMSVNLTYHAWFSQ